MTETSAFSEPLSPEFQDVLPTSTESSTKETPGRYHLVLTAIQERDWESLRALSLLPGGFGEARVEAWKYLLSVPSSGTSAQDDTASKIRSSGTGRGREDRILQADKDSKFPNEDQEPEDLTLEPKDLQQPSEDERQVRLDTDRSFVLYGIDNPVDRDRRKDQLHDLIISLLRKRRKLSYFQGYHDIISVLLLTFEPSLPPLSPTSRSRSRSQPRFQRPGVPPPPVIPDQPLPIPPLDPDLVQCAEKLSLHRVRDSMGSGLEPLVGLLRLMKRLLRLADPEFAALIERSVPLPYFALSNLLTLFSHDVPTLPQIQHIFDFLLSRPPIVTIYLAVAMVLTKKEEAIKLDDEGDAGMMHSVLAQLPELKDDEEPNERLTHDQIRPADSDGGPESTTDAAQSGPSSLQQVDVSGPSSLTFSSPALVNAASISPEEDLAWSLPAVSPTDASSEAEGAKSPDSGSWARTPATEFSSLPSIEVSQSISRPASRNTGGLSSSPDSRSPSVSSLKKHAVLEPAVPHPNAIPLSSLLRRASDLYVQYPPDHDQLNAQEIMGPSSVIYTWTEGPSLLSDDAAEELLDHPITEIVKPYDDFEELDIVKKEVDTTWRFPRAWTNRKSLDKQKVVWGVIFLVGVGIAVYAGGRGGRWKKWSSCVEGVIVGAGSILVGSGGERKEDL